MSHQPPSYIAKVRSHYAYLLQIDLNDRLECSYRNVKLSVVMSYSCQLIEARTHRILHIYTQTHHSLQFLRQLIILCTCSTSEE